MLCRAQIVDLAKHRDELLSRGVQVVIIGPATAEDAAWLSRRMDVPFPVLADGTGEVFAAFGLREGTARPTTLERLVSFGEEHTQFSYSPTYVPARERGR